MPETQSLQPNARMLPIGVRDDHGAGKLTLMERVGNAMKALVTTERERVGIPYYATMGDWDKAITAQLEGAKASGDPNASSLCFAGYRWLANRLPEAVVRVLEPTQDSDKGQPIVDHPLVVKLRRPNPYYSGSTLMKAFAYSWLLNGNVYFIMWRSLSGGVGIGRNGVRLKEVAQFWYEPHWNVTPRSWGDQKGEWLAPTKDGITDNPGDFISYYEVRRGQKKFRLEFDDVIHFRDGIDPENQKLGLSGIGRILREILGDSATADFYTRLMANGGVPPYVVSIDKETKFLKDEDTSKIKAGILNQIANPKAEPLILQGATIEKLGFNPQELDLRVTRYLSEERFSAVTGIPAIVMELGAGQEHSIYRNVEAAEKRATKGYLVPLWWHIDEELSLKALPNFDADTTHWVERDTTEVEALQEDAVIKENRWGKKFAAGGCTRREYRAATGLGPTDPDNPDLDDVICMSSSVKLVPVTEKAKQALDKINPPPPMPLPPTPPTDKTGANPTPPKPNGNSQVV